MGVFRHDCPVCGTAGILITGSELVFLCNRCSLDRERRSALGALALYGRTAHRVSPTPGPAPDPMCRTDIPDTEET